MQCKVYSLSHLDLGGRCVNSLYINCILYLWHTFLMGHTANFWTGRNLGLAKHNVRLGIARGFHCFMKLDGRKISKLWQVFKDPGEVK